MSIHLLTSADDLASYDHRVKSHPQGTLWQSVEWKKYQESLGREVRVYAEIGDERSEIGATALIVIDKTVGGLSTWDIPRGPLGPMENGKWKMENFLTRILDDAKKDKCIGLFFSPLNPVILNSQFSILNSVRHQQPEATRILDLTLSNEQLLAQMHRKGRYNINVARKNGVTVEQSTDVDAYYELAKKTAKRDAFGIPSRQQLHVFIEQLPGSFLLLAKANNTAIAGLIGITWNNTGIYYYGASDYEHRALMAPYLLQWESMQLCKKAECTTYDLLGIAPLDAGAGHPWSGISDFKSKFGGTVVTYPAEHEITLKPIAKRLLEMKRKIVG